MGAKNEDHFEDVIDMVEIGSGCEVDFTTKLRFSTTQKKSRRASLRADPLHKTHG